MKFPAHYSAHSRCSINLLFSTMHATFISFWVDVYKLYKHTHTYTISTFMMYISIYFSLLFFFFVWERLGSRIV